MSERLAREKRSSLFNIIISDEEKRDLALAPSVKTINILEL
jgi:hypothetical protein